MISVCILTKNCAKTLPASLESVRSFPEVIVLDNGSTDDTVQIARAYPNVRVFLSAFLGFGPLRNHAAHLAQSDWILALDSDEVLSPSLIEEIKKLPLDAHRAYALPRHNYYNKKRIRGCGWGKDEVVRLYHRQMVRFSPSQVHEKLERFPTLRLRAPLLHTPYHSTADFLSKMQTYSTLFAEEWRGKKESSFSKALRHGLFAFARSYLFKGGIWDGKEGFLISWYNANTAFYKYLKLMEMNALPSRLPPSS